jgi:hypothetical protein
VHDEEISLVSEHGLVDGTRGFVQEELEEALRHEARACQQRGVEARQALVVVSGTAGALLRDSAVDVLEQHRLELGEG